MFGLSAVRFTLVLAIVALAAAGSALSTIVLRQPIGTGSPGATDSAPDPIAFPPGEGTLPPVVPGETVTSTELTIGGVTVPVPVRLVVLERPTGALADPEILIDGSPRPNPTTANAGDSVAIRLSPDDDLYGGTWRIRIVVGEDPDVQTADLTVPIAPFTGTVTPPQPVGGAPDGGGAVAISGPVELPGFGDTVTLTSVTGAGGSGYRLLVNGGDLVPGAAIPSDAEVRLALTTGGYDTPHSVTATLSTGATITWTFTTAPFTGTVTVPAPAGTVAVGSVAQSDSVVLPSFGAGVTLTSVAVAPPLSGSATLWVNGAQVGMNGAVSSGGTAQLRMTPTIYSRTHTVTATLSTGATVTWSFTTAPLTGTVSVSHTGALAGGTTVTSDSNLLPGFDGTYTLASVTTTAGSAATLLLNDVPVALNGAVTGNGQTDRVRLRVTTGGFSTAHTVTATLSSGATIVWSFSTRAANNCSLDGQTVTHGNSRTFFTTTSVTCGSSCSGQSRTCTDGTLAGSTSFQFANCNAAACSNCNVNGTIVAHGNGQTFFNTTGGCGSSCSSEYRTCTNGSMSGSSSFRFASCSSSCASCGTESRGICSTSGTLLSGGHGTPRTITSGSRSETYTCNNGSWNQTSTSGSCPCGPISCPSGFTAYTACNAGAGVTYPAVAASGCFAACDGTPGAGCCEWNPSINRCVRVPNNGGGSGTLTSTDSNTRCNHCARTFN